MSRETRAVWAKRVERCADSGLTTAEYAAETGVNPKTLAYWRWRLKKPAEPAGVRRQRPRFLEVVRVPDASAASEEPKAIAVERFELVLRSGHRVLVPARFEGPVLRRLVDALEAP